MEQRLYRWYGNSEATLQDGLYAPARGYTQGYGRESKTGVSKNESDGP